MSLKSRIANTGAAVFIVGAATFLGPIESGPKGPQLTPYDDIGGVNTWCYGETAGTPKERYTVAECDALLVKSVEKHWAGIRHAVPEAAPASVKEAVISVAYNVGVSGFLWELDAKGKRVPSRFVAPLARGDWSGVCAAITAPWQGRYGVSAGYKATVKGRPIKGLENRRWQENKVCLRDL